MYQLDGLQKFLCESLFNVKCLFSGKAARLLAGKFSVAIRPNSFENKNEVFIFSEYLWTFDNAKVRNLLNAVSDFNFYLTL